jgi:hypothetical protein
MAKEFLEIISENGDRTYVSMDRVDMLAIIGKTVSVWTEKDGLLSRVKNVANVDDIVNKITGADLLRFISPMESSLEAPVEGG